LNGWCSADPWSTPWTSWQPRVDIAEQEKDYEITIELPAGVNKDDVKIRLTNDDRLVVTGEKKREAHEKRGGWIHEERSYGSFTRSIALPDDVDKSKLKEVRAKYTGEGVIKWCIPRIEHSYVSIDDHSKGAPHLQGQESATSGTKAQGAAIGAKGKTPESGKGRPQQQQTASGGGVTQESRVDSGPTS